MKFKTLALFSAMILFVALGISDQTFAQKLPDKIITFDVPGAGTRSSQGTVPMSINPAGTITGYYVDAGSIFHGFVRDKDGIITPFDAGPNFTTPISINPSGEIAGYYFDVNFRGHGFVRDKDGTITSFDVLGAGSNGTFPASINPRGEITGSYSDASNVSHGFLREP